MSGRRGGVSLAFLRGDKDLFEERRSVCEFRRQARQSLNFWLGNSRPRGARVFWEVVGLLQENSRMPVTEISRRLGVAVSTVFDHVKRAREFFDFTIVLKDEVRQRFFGSSRAGFEYCYEIVWDAHDEAGLSLCIEQEGVF